MEKVIALLVTLGLTGVGIWLIATGKIGDLSFIALLTHSLFLGLLIVRYELIKTFRLETKWGTVEIKMAEEKVGRIEESKRPELSKKYPVVYKVVGILKHKFIPSRAQLPEGLQIDWNSSKVEKVTEDKIEILLPNMTWQTNQFVSNRVTLKKEVGTRARLFSVGDWTQEIEVISVEKDIVVVAIGFIRE